MKKFHINPSCAFWIIGILAIFKKNALFYLLPITFHETSHIIAIVLLKKKISKFSLSCTGLNIDIRGSLSYNEQIIISLAGPLGSILFYFLLAPFYENFANVSLALGLLNLLPISSLDGSGILYPLIANQISFDVSEKIRRIIDIAGTVLFFTLAVFALVITRYNFSVLFMAIYIFALTFLRKENLF